MVRRLVLASLIALTSVSCTRRQADFAWFAAAVALEVAQTSNEIAEANRAASPPPPPPDHAERERSRRIATELTHLAAHDARNGNCGAVAQTSQHVRVIDADVFVDVFLADVAIQRCLAR
jgi:hypothetical protein